MRSDLVAIVLAAGTVVSACGGDDAAAKPEPEQKCESFATTWCRQSMSCLVTVGSMPEANRADSQQTCTDIAIAAVQCKKAVSVASSYAQCITDIEAMDCSIWNVPLDELSTVQPPATCQGIITTSP